MNLQHLFKDTNKILTLPESGTIFEEGDQADVMFVILEGDVEIVANDKPVSSLGSGQIIGEMALIDGQPRSARAVAKTDCRLAIVDEKQFLFMIQETPYFALHVMRVLSDRLRKQNLT